MPVEERSSMSKPEPCVLPDDSRIRLNPGKRNPQLGRFREMMERMVIGQPTAIGTITNSFSRVLAGISDPERPILTMMLLGPTGVGKTETVRALADALFGTRKGYTRINCQEYSAHYNLSKLLGSPPGYVGGEIKPLLCQENLDRHHRKAFEEGLGMFCDGLGKVGKLFPEEEDSYLSLVLFDEIEKAHPKLWNMLLGILEDGNLVLGNNEEVDFTHSIIILTTNVGSEAMGAHIAKETIGFRGGFEGTRLDKDIHEAAMREAKKTFPFEFLNRFDELVVYDTLKEQHLYQILDNLIANIHIRSIDCTEPFLLDVDGSAKTELVRIGTDPQFGARPLRRAVETQLVTPIGNLICSGQIVRGDLITVMHADGEFVFEKEPGGMTTEEIAEFDALRERHEKSRDLDGLDDGGEAKRIVEEVESVTAKPRTMAETGSVFRDD
jgi:ATP-dependent Clp protease ATP-binding subunit ClpA